MCISLQTTLHFGRTSNANSILLHKLLITVLASAITPSLRTVFTFLIYDRVSPRHIVTTGHFFIILVLVLLSVSLLIVISLVGFLEANFHLTT